MILDANEPKKKQFSTYVCLLLNLAIKNRLYLDKLTLIKMTKTLYIRKHIKIIQHNKQWHTLIRMSLKLKIPRINISNEKRRITEKFLFQRYSHDNIFESTFGKHEISCRKIMYDAVFISNNVHYKQICKNWCRNEI